MRRMGQQRHHFIQRGAQQEGDTFEDQFPGFQLREVQHIVDDGQQVVSRTLNGVQMIALGGVEIGFQR